MADSPQDAVKGLDKAATGKSSAQVATGKAKAGQRAEVAMVFTGQGAQYFGMGRELYATQPVFRDVIDQAAAVLDPVLPTPIREVMLGAGSDAADSALIDRTEFTQPALVVIELALAALWKSWGIVPSMVAGHSVGEYAAAHVAGVMDFETTLKLIAERARRMQEMPGGGAMAAVLAPPDRVEPWVRQVGNRVTIAAHNGPKNTVVSGDEAAVVAVMELANAAGVTSKRLVVSHAFHSHHMDPMLAGFTQFASGLKFNAPKIPLVSNLTGKLMTGAPDAKYWAEHLRGAVRFTDCATEILKRNPAAVIEAGPSPHLTGMLRQTAESLTLEQTPRAVGCMRKGTDEWSAMMSAAGEAYCVGVALDWTGIFGKPHQRLALPTYPFQRERHWVEDPTTEQAVSDEANDTGGLRHAIVHPLLGAPVDAAVELTIYESWLSSREPAFLADHVVQGSVVVPAAAYLEIGLAAARETYGDGQHTLESFVIQQPLFLTEKPRLVQTSIEPERNGRATFQVFSRGAAAGTNSAWTLHARGVLVRGPAVAEPNKHDEQGKAVTSRIVGADAELKNFIEHLHGTEIDQRSRDEFYELVGARGLVYGPMFQVLGGCSRSHHEAVLPVQLPDAVRHAKEFLLHPATLDGCMQAVAGVTPLDPNGEYTSFTYMPTGLGKLQKHRDGEPHTIIARRTLPSDNTPGPEVVQADVEIWDEHQQLLVSLTDVRVHRASGRSHGSQAADTSRWLYQVIWESMPLDGAESSRADGAWCVVGPNASEVARYAQTIEAQGGRVHSVIKDGAALSVDAWSKELKGLAKLASPLRGVLFLNQSTQSVAIETAEQRTLSLMHLVQALSRMNGPAPALTVVTQGAQPVTQSSDVTDPSGGALWGLARVAQVEHPELAVRILDLDPTDAAAHVEQVVGELLSKTDENQVAYRQGQRRIARLRATPEALPHDQHSAADGPLKRPADGPFRLRLDGSNRIDGLWLERSSRTAPAKGEVELEVRAAGLNFSDVLKAMGLYPGITDAIVPLGIECAGVVTAIGPDVKRFKPGDAVLGVAPYSFSSHAVTREYTLAHCPASLTPEEAATIPITFMTAHYGLVRLAQLQPGERVLIHAGAGGVGLAAIQIAQHIGAEIYTTAGSDSKREFLHELGVKHVFSSRTLDFADQILDLTDRRGVDVVLNSLPGEAIDRSIGILSAYGRFLEIGKTDIYQNRMIGLLPFQDNLSYFAIDLDRVLRQKPTLVRGLFDEVMELFADGIYQPLPLREFSIEQVRGAFRYMAQRKNIGKVVVSVSSSRKAVTQDTVETSKTGTQLITGGLGALGLRLANYLADCGETHLALLGRRGPSDAVQAEIDALRHRGIHVTVIAGDVGDRQSLEKALASIPEEYPPLRGVWHAAGVLRDGVLLQMQDQQLMDALAPKLRGTWNLHHATLNHPIEKFVLFSSIACLLGSPGQANYSAGNASLDAIAHYRLGQGLPATVVNWGPWADAGMATGGERQDQLAGRGLTLLPAAQAFEVLGAAVANKVAQVAVLDANWKDMLGGRPANTLPSLMRGPSELAGDVAVARAGLDHAFRDSLMAADQPNRIKLLTGYFADQLGGIMGLDPDQVDPQQSLGSMGLDSLMAIELKNTIEARIGVVLSMARFMEGPSIHQLAEQVAEMVQSGQEVAQVNSPQQALSVDQAAKLSHGQRALWFLNQLAPESTAYNISDAVLVRGPLQTDVLEKAIQALVDSHEALRTTFVIEDGRPQTRVVEKMRAPLQVHDVEGWSEEQLHQAITDLVHEPFDLERGPLIRVHMFRQSDDVHVLFFSVHHIIADFWSLVFMTDQFRRTYAALRTGGELPAALGEHQYQHFVDWQDRMLATAEGKKQEEYWLKQLGGDLPVLELPCDRPRPAVQTYRGSLAFSQLDPELTTGLKRIAKDHEMTLNMVLLAGYQLMLHQLSGQDDLLVGMPTSGRSRNEFASIVGYFVNPVVSRSRLEGLATTADYFAQVRASMLGALEHQDFPLPLLVDILKPERDPSRSTLFQCLFVMQKAQMMHEEGLTPFLMGKSGAVLEVADLKFESMTLDQWVAQFDVSLAASEADGGISLGLQYNTDLFDEATAQAMLARYERLLKSFVQKTNAPLHEHRCLTENEAKTVLDQWGDGGEVRTSLEPLHQRFERQAIKTPAAVALVCGDERWTYQELNERANRLAHQLVAAGAGRGDRVGVCLEREPALIASMLAAWKIGAAYVPLDPKYPTARLRRIADTSGMSAMIVSGNLGSQLALTSAKVVPAEVAFDGKVKSSNINATVSLDDAAYVIYTSGSTGDPKGAAVYHRGFANLVEWYIEQFRLGADDRALVVTSHGFDLTQKNLFAPLLVGGQVHLAAGEVFDPEIVGQEIASGEVTLLNCTPSNLYPIVEHSANLQQGRLKSLRWVVLGGEPIDRARLQTWWQQPWCAAQVVNSYGPTECSDVVAYDILPLHEAGPTPIGRPVTGCRLYVLDSRKQLVPPGVVGQLYIGGICVGAGYVNDATLTATKFVSDPFADEASARMYASGDLCRWRADGRLEFVGRADHQVKIRGYRIELGELESVLSSLSMVREAVAVVHEDAAKQKRLVAYVVPAQNETISTEALASELKNLLPPQLIPSAIMVLPKFPLTAHGKVDRRSLPTPDERDRLTGAGYVAPSTEAEKLLAEVWGQILKVDQVGIHDNFFTLGGDSLLAIQVVSRVADRGWRCTPANLLRCQTIAELAAVLRPVTSTEMTSSSAGDAAAGPLLPAQQLWLDHHPEAPRHDNLRLLMKVPSGLDSARLAQAAVAVAQRHGALRTRLEQNGNRWVQVVEQSAAPNLIECIDLRKVEHAEAAFEKQLHRFQQGFDPHRAPLARFAYFDLGAGGGRLYLAAHHLVIDPVSMRVVVEDLLAAYQFGPSMIDTPVAAGSQIASEMDRQTKAGEFDREAERWLAVAQHVPQPLTCDFVCEHDVVANAEIQTVRLSTTTTEALLADRTPARMSAALLAAIGTGYRSWSGRTELRCDIETSGRDLEIEGTDVTRAVGWLVSMYPLDLPTQDAAQVLSSFEQVWQQLSAVPNGGVGYGALRTYAPEATRRALSAIKPAAVRFNYLGRIRESGDAETPVEIIPQHTGNDQAPTIVRPHAIEIDAQVIDGQLEVRWTYSRRRHRAETIAKWSDQTVAALELIAQRLGKVAKV